MKDPLEQAVVGDVDRRRIVANLAVLAATVLVIGFVRPGVLVITAILLAIVVMIMLHELGHFVMAKRADMKVTEYFLGFGPKLWSFRRGETEYGIKAIPAGGYVRIIGMSNLEEVDPADEDRTYRSKPYRQRLGVAVAGSTVHMILAISLFFVVLAGVGLPRAQPVVEQVESGTPASKAGLRSGDRIVAIDGNSVKKWETATDIIRRHPGESIMFTVLRDGRERELAVVPMERKDEEGKRIGFAGLRPEITNERIAIPRAARESVSETWFQIQGSVDVIRNFFAPSGLRRYGEVLTKGESEVTDTRFLSPVGAARVAGQAAHTGLVEVLSLLALINVFVGIFNMVPLLPFDGGHVVIATYEKIASTIRRRRVQVDVRRLMPITAVVLVLVIFLSLSSLYLDIVDPIENPF